MTTTSRIVLDGVGRVGGAGLVGRVGFGIVGKEGVGAFIDKVDDVPFFPELDEVFTPCFSKSCCSFFCSIERLISSSLANRSVAEIPSEWIEEGRGLCRHSNINTLDNMVVNLVQLSNANGINNFS